MYFVSFRSVVADFTVDCLITGEGTRGNVGAEEIWRLLILAAFL